MSWAPTLDEDTSGRADGEQWRSRYTDKWGTVYVEAVKVDGRVYIAPVGTFVEDHLAWLRLP